MQQLMAPTPLFAQARPASIEVLAFQFDALADEISGRVGQELHDALEDWREGRRRKVIVWIERTRGSTPGWLALPPEVQAKVLRLQASVLLDSGDAAGAASPAEQAAALSVDEGNARLQAFLTLQEKGAAAAVVCLAGCIEADSLNLRASLLLEMDQLAQAREALEAAEAVAGAHAETQRLRALWHLANGDVGAAQVAVQKALALRPHWLSVREASAVVDYATALSPAVRPHQIFPMPQPVAWVLVKRDRRSLEALRRAQDTLTELLETNEVSDSTRLRWQGWLLVCLANDPDGQREAADMCETILGAEADSYLAVSWGLARGLIADTKRTKTALSRLLRTEPTIPRVVALALLHVHARQGYKAVRLLEKHQPLFSDPEAEQMWRALRAESWLADGRTDRVLSELGDRPSGTADRYLRALALRVQAHPEGDLQAVLAYLEDSYSETGDTRFLLEAAEVGLENGQWDWVADHAEALLSGVGTAEALRLGLIGAFNAGRFGSAVSLLTSFVSLYADEKLPTELRRIEAISKFRIGMVAEGLAEAEELARDEPTVANLMVVAELYWEAGDVHGVVRTARRLKGASDLEPGVALRLAGMVRLDDPALALDLWARAATAELPDDLVGAAVALGLSLGARRHVPELHERMAELAKHGLAGIQQRHVSELPSFLREVAEQQKLVDEAYKRGELPVHMIQQLDRIPLAIRYHVQPLLSKGSPSPFRQPPLLVRHGGRGPAPGSPDGTPDWRLCLDVTSFLLAAHLDLLTLVEETFGPLKVPEHLPTALIRMRDDVSHTQRPRLQADREIIRLVQQHRIKVLASDAAAPGREPDLPRDWLALYERARTENGFLLSFVPVMKPLSDEEATLPEDSDLRVVNSRAVVEALREGGQLSRERYLEALALLGREGQQEPTPVRPAPGQPLYCHGNTAESLAIAGVLGVAAAAWPLYIGQWQVDHAHSLVETAELESETVGWLNELIAHVNVGLVSGKYRSIPAPQGLPPDLTDDATPELWCLLTLAELVPESHEVVWFDDRHVTAHPSQSRGVSVVGILEVLKALASAGSISESEYYAKLHRLRADNVRYLPFEAGEFLHWLRQAPTGQGELNDAQELRVLRSYAAACLAQGEWLQLPSAPDQPGELPFLLSLSHSIGEACVLLWKGEATEEEAEVRADWLLDNLYMDHLSIARATGRAVSPEKEHYLVAASLMGLLSAAIAVEGRLDLRRRRSYFAWLERRLLVRQFDANPRLGEALAELMKSLFRSLVDEASAENYHAIAQTWLQQLHQDLPERLRAEIERDSAYMALIGLRLVTLTQVGDLVLEREEFLRAASAAVNGGVSAATLFNSEKVAELCPLEASGEQIGFVVHSPDGRSLALLDTPVSLLHDSVAAREALLRRNRHWFDTRSEELAQIIAEIVATDDPAQRVGKAERWHGTSASVYYARLREVVSRRERLHFGDFLPPDETALLRYFRLPAKLEEGEAFQAALISASESLIRDEGLAEAIRRLSGLPVALPEPIMQAVMALSAEARRDLIRELLREAPTVLGRIHLVRFLDASASDTPAYPRLMRRVIRALVGEHGTAECKAFSQLLRWLNDRIHLWQERAEWPIQYRLAVTWLHGQQLHLSLQASGVGPEWYEDTFPQAGHQLTSELFEREPAHWHDVAHPARLSPVRLVLSGLSYALSRNAASALGPRELALLADAVGKESDGVRYPDPGLLRDITRAIDNLSSFLCRDAEERLCRVLGEEAAEGLALLRTRMPAMLEPEAPPEGEQVRWAFLQAVFGDLPSDAEWSTKLSTLLECADFAELARADAGAGALAVFAGASLATQLGEPLRDRIRHQLSQVARCLAEAVPSASAEQADLAVLWLLEAALTLSIVPGCTAAENAARYSQLVGQVVEQFPAAAPIYRPFVERLWLDMPLPVSAALAPLLARLRCD